MTGPDRQGTLEIAGQRIETAAWGAAEGPTIVLLHHGLGSVALWQGFPAALAAATGARILAYSRPGYGRSAAVPPPWPLDFLHREATGVLPAVLQTLGRGPFVLVGHSDGGSIATIRAGSAQDPRLAGIALLAPHFFVEPITLAGIRDAAARWASGELRGRLAPFHDDPDATFAGWSGAWLDPGFPRVLDLQPEIAHIRVPVLMVQGDADPFGTVAQVRMLEAEAYCPVDALVLPGIGHAPQAEAAEPVLAAIADFARRALAAQAPGGAA
jgi:pimeloyl-ACP methyl ester carboxylesterase